MSLKKYVNFSIDNSFGNTLMTIAFEKLFYDFEFEKAFDVIKKSLIGIPDNLVSSLFKGTGFLEVDGETQQVLVTTFDRTKHERHHFWEVPDLWAIKLHSNTVKELDSIHSTLRDVERKLKQDFRKSFFAEVSEDALYKYVFEENANFSATKKDLVINIEDRFYDSKECVKSHKRFLKKAFKIAKCLKDLSETDLVQEKELVNSYSLDIITIANGIKTEIMLLSMGESITQEGFAVKEYIDNIKKIDNDLKNGVKPINVILDNIKDAYWISPDGITYGLDGDISNMLHINLADAIQEKYKFNLEEQYIDTYLEENGWAKLTSNWVLYGGYYHDKPMTKKQQDIIGIIGQRMALDQNKYLRFGYKQDTISSTRFKMLSQVNLKKLFGIT